MLAWIQSQLPPQNPLWAFVHNNLLIGYEGAYTWRFGLMLDALGVSNLALLGLVYPAIARFSLPYFLREPGSLAMVHLALHASLCTWQFLRSSSLIVDFQENPVAREAILLGQSIHVGAPHSCCSAARVGTQRACCFRWSWRRLFCTRCFLPSRIPFAYRVVNQDLVWATAWRSAGRYIIATSSSRGGSRSVCPEGSRSSPKIFFSIRLPNAHLG